MELVTRLPKYNRQPMLASKDQRRVYKKLDTIIQFLTTQPQDFYHEIEVDVTIENTNFANEHRSFDNEDRDVSVFFYRRNYQNSEFYSPSYFNHAKKLDTFINSGRYPFIAKMYNDCGIIVVTVISIDNLSFKDMEIWWETHVDPNIRMEELEKKMEKMET